MPLQLFKQPAAPHREFGFDKFLEQGRCGVQVGSQTLFASAGKAEKGSSDGSATFLLIANSEFF